MSSFYLAQLNKASDALLDVLTRISAKEIIPRVEMDRLHDLLQRISLVSRTRGVDIPSVVAMALRHCRDGQLAVQELHCDWVSVLNVNTTASIYVRGGVEMTGGVDDTVSLFSDRLLS